MSSGTRFWASLLLLGSLGACQSVSNSTRADTSDSQSLSAGDKIQSKGTLQYSTLEGGFFYIRDQSGKLYLPLGSIVADFRVEDAGRPISFQGTKTTDYVDFRMTGEMLLISDLSFN